MPSLKFRFRVLADVDAPVEIGFDETGVGRRRLIYVPGGRTEGEGCTGTLLPGGVDSPVIHPDGKADISARYGVKFDDGTSVYIQNDGIRTVPPEEAKLVLNGGFVDPSHYYFVTSPVMEVYDESRDWMTKKIWICIGTRKPENVVIEYYTVELD